MNLKIYVPYVCTNRLCRKEINYEVPLFDEIYFCFPLHTKELPLFGTYTLIYQGTPLHYWVSIFC